jgi:RNA polymerase sigma factor (sigma-70 family)
VADIESVRVEPYYDWEGDLIRDELSGDMQWALDELPEVYRLAVLLADVEDLTYQEIATVLECPIGTVMSRLNRGRRMLARSILARRNDRAPAARPVLAQRRS